MGFVKLTIIFSGSAHNMFVKVCSLISDNSQLFIQWPQEKNYAQLAAQNSFPDALGRVKFLKFLI